MKQHLWWASITGDQCPPWPCPTCGEGTIVLIPKTLENRETAESEKAHGQDSWEPDWIEYVFTAWGRCSNDECVEQFAISGTGEVGDDGLGERYVDVFSPKFCTPMPNMIEVPANSPTGVRDALHSAFEVFWSSPSAASNLIRIAVERLLDHLGIDSTRPDASGNQKRVQLHARLEQFKQVNQVAAEQLMAIKWLGNTGSHTIALSKSDVLDGLEILEHVIAEVIGQRTNRIQSLVDGLTASHDPRRPDPSTPLFDTFDQHLKSRTWPDGFE